MIFGLSTNFISLPPEDVDDGINDVLKAVGMFGGVDRSCVFQFDGSGGALDKTHEWRANGQGGQVNRVSAEMQPWFYERIKGCEVVCIPDVEALPPEAENEKSISGRWEFAPALPCRLYRAIP